MICFVRYIEKKNKEETMPHKGCPCRLAPTGMEMEYLRGKIGEVQNFPVDGIGFKNITALLEDAEAFRIAVDGLASRFADKGIKKVVGIESRGFEFSGSVAYLLGAGTVMARKKGKLPGDIIACAHELEYGISILEMRIDSITKGERVLIIDDVLATGGTALAAVNLAERLGGVVVGLGFLLELPLGGREKLNGYSIHSLIRY